MFGRHKDEVAIRESTSNDASSQNRTIDESEVLAALEEDFLAALEGNVAAFKRLQSRSGGQPSQATIDEFLALGGPRLLGALRQVQLFGMTIDPSSKFAKRLEEFEKDVEAATNGDLGAYLRLNLANGIHPTAKQIADFKADGGPSLVPTLRQRELMGKTTDPKSQFGQRVEAWREAMAAQFGQKPTGSTSPAPTGTGSSRGTSSVPSGGGHVIPDRGSAAPDRPTGSGGRSGGRPAGSDTPGSSSSTTEVVSMGSGWVGGGTTYWNSTGVYKDGTLTVTTTTSAGPPTTSTLTGDAAAKAVAAAKELQAQKDAQDQAAKDQAAKDQAAKDEAAKDEADAAAEDATADPDPDTGAALRNPDYSEGGASGTVTWETSGPPPQGVAGHALFGGDFGNPMYVEFVGGGLLMRVVSSPDVDPDATAAGEPGLIGSDEITPPTGIHVPFGGDFGNPDDRPESGTWTPPKGDGHDPYE